MGVGEREKEGEVKKEGRKPADPRTPILNWIIYYIYICPFSTLASPHCLPPAPPSLP